MRLAKAVLGCTQTCLSKDPLDVVSIYKSEWPPSRHYSKQSPRITFLYFYLQKKNGTDVVMMRLVSVNLSSLILMVICSGFMKRLALENALFEQESRGCSLCHYCDVKSQFQT